MSFEIEDPVRRHSTLTPPQDIFRCVLASLQGSTLKHPSFVSSFAPVPSYLRFSVVPLIFLLASFCSMMKCSFEDFDGCYPLVSWRDRQGQGRCPLPPIAFLHSTQCGPLVSGQNQIIARALFEKNEFKIF